MMWSVTEHQISMIVVQLRVTQRGTGEIFRSMLQPQFGPSVPKQDENVPDFSNGSQECTGHSFFCKRIA